MESRDRATINRENAQKSTGPRTPAGKARSSRNALRHGLTAQHPEDSNSLTTLTHNYTTEFAAQGQVEATLVEAIATATWKLQRGRTLEKILLDLEIDPTDPFAADQIVARSKGLLNLSVYEQRNYRTFEKALKELRQIQTERRKREREELAEAGRCKQLHDDLEDARIEEHPEETPIPYDPAADGFVYSNSEIDAHLALQFQIFAGWYHDRKPEWLPDADTGPRGKIRL